MMQQEFIRQQIGHIEELISKAKEHARLSTEELEKRPAPEKWNALECYEHLNRYGLLYMAYFDEAISKGKNRKGDPRRRSGWFGGWSARTMAPKEVGVRSPMKTFKDKNPLGEEVRPLVIETFIEQQKMMRDQMQRSSRIDIDKVRSKTTLPLMRFKLSDTFEFVVNHSRRHQLQAERAIDDL